MNLKGGVLILKEKSNFDETLMSHLESQDAVEIEALHYKNYVDPIISKLCAYAEKVEKYRRMYLDEVQKNLELTKQLEEKTDKLENITIDTVVNALTGLKKVNKDQKVLMETPEGSLYLKLGDALIYEGCVGELVLDSE